MRKLIFTAVAPAALAATALALAATAAAEPVDTTVKGLQNEGYQVQVNRVTGSTTVSLSKCQVTGIHPSNLDASASKAEKGSTLVTVDASCPNHDN